MNCTSSSLSAPSGTVLEVDISERSDSGSKKSDQRIRVGSRLDACTGGSKTDIKG